MLALDYRPRRVADFSGQQHITLVIDTMLRRWQAQEIDLPPGIVLAGPRGSGKTSMARVIAAALNCLSETSDIPCSQCEACRAVFGQLFNAVLEVDGATSGLVDDVRQLKTLARLSHGGGYRVIIIDECHAMSKEAFSALLKQLEEPPPNVLYILVTTDFQQIPSTVVSRCLTFSYNPISEADITARLEFICKAEALVFESSALEHIALMSRGAMRDAVMKLEHLSMVRDISYKRAIQLWPADLDVFARKFMESVYSADSSAAMLLIHEYFQRHRDCMALVDGIVEYLITAVEAGITKDLARSLTLRKTADLMAAAWDLRIKLRSAHVGDPTLLEMMWFVYVRELGTAPSQYAQQNLVMSTTPTLPSSKGVHALTNSGVSGSTANRNGTQKEVLAKLADL